MKSISKSYINNTPIDLTAICRLDDSQLFYEETIRKHTENSAARFLATLYLIGNQGNDLAITLFKNCEDLEATNRLFIQYRELDSTARSLISSYESNDKPSINFHLMELYALLYPLKNLEMNSLPLMDIKLSQGTNVRFPLLNGIITTSQDTDLKSVTENVLKSFNAMSNKLIKSEWISDFYSISKIRISPSSIQPLSAGNEFSVIEKGQLALPKSIKIAQKALNGLATLDSSLATIMSQIMKLVTIVPRQSLIVRKAGSVSSLPGWAWQDVDPQNSWIDEYCHLSVQLTHEFFHTKVNLLEKTVALYTTDGNSPEIFSPWKNRMRPLRQVIHALMTFSAGAAIWVKLIKSPWLNTKSVYSRAEDYWKKTIKFADKAHKNLVETKMLTPAGLILIDSCISNLRKVINSV